MNEQEKTSKSFIDSLLSGEKTTAESTAIAQRMNESRDNVGHSTSILTNTVSILGGPSRVLETLELFKNKAITAVQKVQITKDAQMANPQATPEELQKIITEIAYGRISPGNIANNWITRRSNRGITNNVEHYENTSMAQVRGLNFVKITKLVSLNAIVPMIKLADGTTVPLIESNPHAKVNISNMYVNATSQNQDLGPTFIAQLIGVFSLDKVFYKVNGQLIDRSKIAVIKEHNEKNPSQKLIVQELNTQIIFTGNVKLINGIVVDTKGNEAVKGSEIISGIGLFMILEEFDAKTNAFSKSVVAVKNENCSMYKDIVTGSTDAKTNKEVADYFNSLVFQKGLDEPYALSNFDVDGASNFVINFNTLTANKGVN